MNPLLWPTASPPPIPLISPSAINTYMRCPRKLAFQRDPSLRNLSKPTLRTALGVAAHSLHEIAATNSPPPNQEFEGWLREEWERLLGEQSVRVAEAWPGRAVPPAGQWNGVGATRVRTLRTLAQSRASSPSARKSRTETGFPWIERRLEDLDTGIFGTPDRVDVRNGQLRVVDLKSGVYQAEMQPGQRLQLLLYAHLVDVACNQLPTVGVIKDARGIESTFQIDSVAVTRAIAVARQVMTQYNAAVALRDVPASPEAATCLNCPYRVVCEPYWSSEARSAGDLRGTVSHVESRSFAVDTGTSGAVRVVAAQGCAVPAIGDEAVVLDLLPAGSGTLRMRWNSDIRLPSEE